MWQKKKCVIIQVHIFSEHITPNLNWQYQSAEQENETAECLVFITKVCLVSVNKLINQFNSDGQQCQPGFGNL